MHKAKAIISDFLRNIAAGMRPVATRTSIGVLAIVFAYGALPGISAWDPKPANAAARKPIDIEATHQQQHALLGQAIRNLAPQRPGTTDLYFVAFGGYAHQDVFLREVRTISNLFDDRFGTAGRSIRLVNNPATVRQYPLANRNNLGATLSQIGKRLDPREDILFLFLTSHGRPNWLSVDFRPLRLKDLSARTLRTMLDWSGIKWRVIVVSACYSGSFVDALADDNTLVMTAARHDRTSFGCAHENDFTYFGRAYFNEALRQTYSFTDAFEMARKTIEKREAAAGLKPSLPQIAIGKAIAPRLDALSRGLRRQTGDQIAARPAETDTADPSAE